MSADLDLKDLSLPKYIAYLPAEIPVKIESGKLSIQGTASYRIGKEYGGEAGWDGSVTLTEIKVAEQGGPARVAVDSVIVRSRATSGEKRGLLLEDGSLEIRKVTIPFGEKDGMSVGLLAFQGARFSDKKNELDLASVLLEDSHVRLSRDRKGAFSPQTVVDGLTKKLPKARPAAPAQPPIKFRIARVEGKGIDVLFTDGTRKELPAFSITGAHFLAQDVTGPGFGKMPFEFSAKWGKDTTIRGKGWAVPTPLAVDAEMQIQGFDLASAGPYLGEDAQIIVAGGRFDATLAAKVQTRNDKLAGTFQGSAAVRSLDVLDAHRGKLLAWDALTIDGIQGTVDPMKVQVKNVALAGLRANVVMDEKGNSNLPKGSAPKDTGATDGKQAPTKKQGDSVQELSIDDFHLTKGTIDFTDRSVPGPFKAQVRDVDVRLTGMSTAPGKIADLRARLVLPKGAPLTITGKAAPLKEPAYADMDLVLDKLDLTTATPYAGTFLGLEVDKGTLTVKSRAKVEKGDIAAENRIWVEQLTYGKPVKSDKATILPVRLLTDILRNKDGDIVMVLPVAARTDDENLVGTVVGQVAKEVVFPPSSPLRSIPFDGCSADLTKDAQDRLRKLADALDERKAMKIVAIGYVDRNADEKACAVRIAAEREKTAAAAPGRPPQAPTAAAAPVPVPAPPAFLSLDGEARLQQLAASRADTVRAFLVGEGKVESPRVLAKAGDIHATPTKEGDAQPRVEFARQGD
jgi:outer membrane protein OmpA-like peptidoglycan-associated protein